jgi:hypothetical protein
MKAFARNPGLRLVAVLLCLFAPWFLTGCTCTCNSNKPPADGPPLVEVRQRSVFEDPAVRGDFGNDWLVTGAGAGLPHADPVDSEIAEFIESYERTQTPGLVQVDLAPGATQTVPLQVTGPSGLAAAVGWIGTTSPLNVTIALGASTLATGTPYHYGHDRGGAYVQAKTTAGGTATVSVTNTTGAAVLVRIVFMATSL